MLPRWQQAFPKASAHRFGERVTRRRSPTIVWVRDRAIGSMLSFLGNCRSIEHLRYQSFQFGPVRRFSSLGQFFQTIGHPGSCFQVTPGQRCRNQESFFGKGFKNLIFVDLHPSAGAVR